MSDDEIPRDCLTPVLGAMFVALGLVSVLVALLVGDPKRDAVPVGARMVAPVGYYPTIAATGEWVTNPDGSRVCRLRAPIARGMTFRRSLCEDWQSQAPEFAQQVPWLRTDRSRGLQIMIEGSWRP